MKRAVLLAVALSAALAAGSFPNDERTIEHVLNRIAYGARPGDVEDVRKTGLQRYIDRQLHPERIDDGRIAGRLDGLTTVKLSSREIEDRFERPLIEAR